MSEFRKQVYWTFGTLVAVAAVCGLVVGYHGYMYQQAPLWFIIFVGIIGLGVIGMFFGLSMVMVIHQEETDEWQEMMRKKYGWFK